MTSTEPAAATPPRSPFAGCLIIGLAVALVLGLAGFAWWTVQRQSQEISKFTETEAKPVPLPEIAERAGEINTLVAKIQHFSHEVTKGRPARLELSTAELNLSIAAFEAFQQLRHTFHIESIKDGTMSADISFQLGSAPFSDRENHLNARMIAQPVLNNGHIYLEISELTPNTGSVPAPFLEHLSPYRITEIYQEHPEIGPVMTALTSLETGDEQVTFVFDPEASPPSSEQEATEVAKQARNLMALVAIILILSMILLFLLLAKRRKARKNAQP
ncbi:MAG: hypothetical protein ACQKBY_06325 [Verrucomicrobiales bacterium]